MVHMNGDNIIQALGLEAHPEGGFYRETWRCQDRAAAPRLGDRCFGTSIYFLLRAGDVSRFHRLASDEIWHFHQGDPITVAMLTQDDGLKLHLVGGMDGGMARPQLVIPKNTWFGAVIEGPSAFGYTLVGCTVSPGFDFRDFELARPEDIWSVVSHRPMDQTTQQWIERLT